MFLFCVDTTKMARYEMREKVSMIGFDFARRKSKNHVSVCGGIFMGCGGLGEVIESAKNLLI